jgi:two-component system, chemotaxis family, chemotaxis protein CheY
MSLHPSMPILLVDDFETMISIVRSMLRQLGFPQVDAELDARIALRRLRKKQYGLVISDWNMAPMSGYDLLKEVRADPNLASIPFILITGSCSAEAVLAAKAAGVSDYIIKPFTAETLQRKLRAVCATTLEQEVTG